MVVKKELLDYTRINRQYSQKSDVRRPQLHIYKNHTTLSSVKTIPDIFFLRYNRNNPRTNGIWILHAILKHTGPLLRTRKKVESMAQSLASCYRFSCTCGPRFYFNEPSKFSAPFHPDFTGAVPLWPKLRLSL